RHLVERPGLKEAAGAEALAQLAADVVEEVAHDRVVLRARAGPVADAKVDGVHQGSVSRSQAQPGNALSCRLRLLFCPWMGHPVSGTSARRSLAGSAVPGRAWDRGSDT